MFYYSYSKDFEGLDPVVLICIVALLALILFFGAQLPRKMRSSILEVTESENIAEEDIDWVTLKKPFQRLIFIYWSCAAVIFLGYVLGIVAIVNHFS